MNYCLACGHYLPVSGVTLRCTDCDEKWSCEYRIRDNKGEPR